MCGRQHQRPTNSAAAALHDTIEDKRNHGSGAQSGVRIGDRGRVAEMTDDKSLPKTERKRLQIEHARHMSREGTLVKLADEICNLRDIARVRPRIGTSSESASTLTGRRPSSRNCRRPPGVRGSRPCLTRPMRAGRDTVSGRDATLQATILGKNTGCSRPRPNPSEAIAYSGESTPISFRLPQERGAITAHATTRALARAGPGPRLDHFRVQHEGHGD